MSIYPNRFFATADEEAEYNRVEAARRQEIAEMNGYKTYAAYERDEATLSRNLNNACRCSIW